MPSARIIAETAFSHEGDSGYLEKLVERLSNSSADVIKFQILINPEYTADHPMATKCRTLMLDKQTWLGLINKVKRSGKQVMILPVDLGALKWVMSENLADILEIHSVNLFRRDYYDYLKSANPDCELMLSVSGYELDSVDFIVNHYKNLNLEKLSLMFGFQAFPTKTENLALERLKLLSERFGVDVGYADHTAWNEDSTNLIAASVALGAKSVEKHVVLDAGSERIDFNSAVDVDGFNSLAETARQICSAIGDSTEYPMSDAERNYGNRRLRLIASEFIGEGERLAPPKANYFWSNASSEKSPVGLFKLFGSKASVEVSEGEVIA